MNFYDEFPYSIHITEYDDESNLITLDEQCGTYKVQIIGSFFCDDFNRNDVIARVTSVKTQSKNSEVNSKDLLWTYVLFYESETSKEIIGSFFKNKTEARENYMSRIKTTLKLLV